MVKFNFDNITCIYSLLLAEDETGLSLDWYEVW